MLESEAARQSSAKVSMDHIVHNRDACSMYNFVHNKDACSMDHIVHPKDVPVAIFSYSQSHICSYLPLLPGILAAIRFIENRSLDHE